MDKASLVGKVMKLALSLGVIAGISHAFVFLLDMVEHWALFNAVASRMLE